MDKNERIKYLFDQAVDLSPEERTAFIEAECDDESLRATVFLYLNGHDAPASDLVNPIVDAPDVVATLGLNVAEFQLIRQLGIGGMGDVFLAEDTILKRHVAIKTLSPRLLTNEKAIGRFRYEAQAAARLDHPAIVSVFSYGEDAGTHFIAMEYIEGETLAKHLNALIHPKKRSSNKENSEHLPPTKPSDSGRVSYAVQLTARVADALEYAHQQKVIHRDVKPSNILLDKKGNPHLADFGIAKIIDVEPLTLTHEFTGTYHYASPEQAKANRASIDNRSDVFSLGVVLYEMLTLNRPFTGDTSQQILEAVCVHEPLDVRKINDSIPRDLATICHKALEKRPVDRYQSAGHMAADLRSFEKLQPILAQPPGWVRRLRKFSQRHRLLIAMLLVLTTGVSVGRWITTNNNDYARLTVQTDDKSTDTHVSIYPYNSTLDNQRVIDHMGKRVEQGNLSSNHAFEIKLTPGVYWVIVKGIDGGFSERAVFLTAQADQVIKLNPTSPVGPIDEMAYIKTGDENTAFWIDRYEVSNKRFRAFLASLEPTERKNMRPLIWPTPYDIAWDNLPVVGVNWESASRFASWENKRLPTVSEWESAVRGAAGRRFPWGDTKVDPSCRANAGEIGGDPTLFLPGSDFEAARKIYLLAVRPVSDTSKPRSNACTQTTIRMDETTEGVSHLYGNVLEWTCSPLSDSMRIPFAGRLLRRNIKGKAWQSQPNQGTELLGQRIIHNGETQLLGLGFRCVRSLQSKHVMSENSP